MKPVSDTQFACPACDATYQQRPGIEGRKVRCKCGYVGLVPSASPSTASRDTKLKPRHRTRTERQGAPPPPTTSTSGQAEAHETVAVTPTPEIKAIAVAQRWLDTLTRAYVLLIVGGPIFVLALAMLGFILDESGFAVGDAVEGLAGAMGCAGAVVILILKVAIVTFVARLAPRVCQAGIDVLLTLLAIPFLTDLIAVVILSRKANAILRDNGIKTGFFGPDMSQFKTT